MTESLIADRAPSDAEALAAPFAAMAEQIRHNGAQSFGGAFVIVPPAIGGEPIVTLVLDPKQDPILFWASVKSKIDMVLAQLEEAARGHQAFRR